MPPEARQEIEAVLSTFRQWLLEAEQWRSVLPPRDDEEPAADTAVDLHTLLGEWIALKQEVRLEARGGKAARADLDRAVGEFREGLGRVGQQAQQAIDPLLRERDRLRDELNSRLESQQRSSLELLLDIREALARGERSSRLAAGRLGWRRRLLPRGLFDGMVEGYGLALRRVDAALESRGVRPILCLGRPVDPERMRVVDLVQSDDLDEGRVAEVMRDGYTWGDKVIRYAEVRATARKRPDGAPSAGEGQDIRVPSATEEPEANNAPGSGKGD